MEVISKECMLTTTDNPFNPFTQWDDWLTYDESQGYHTCGYIARIANVSDELSEEDQDIAIQIAIDEIVELNITGNYKKVYNT
jgi:hypothetical protein